ncbi:Fip1-domain-containing protein [Thozetella sp. PMI_491]|nr:Fip1-domain-containing protein [Thozetella sp. PMI_491]
MDIDEDDDFYAPEEPDVPTADAAPAPAEQPKADAQDDDLEEGEEEDEGGEMDEDDDSDVDIIVERKDGSQPAPQSHSKYSEIRNIPQRSTVNDDSVKTAPVRDDKKFGGSGGDHPPISASKIDVDGIPIHKGTGKPITQVNIDEDLKDSDKPWRQPGTDLSDYFNYGFDEFTWALYADKQERLRGEFSQDAIAQGQKKMMEDMMMMMGGGSMMPGMPGAGGNGGGATQMPAMDGMPPEMQGMLQQMMMSGGGMDGQMDPNAMAAMFAGMQNGGGAGGNAGQGGQGQAFPGGFAGNQNQVYGFDQQMAGGNAGGGNRGNFGGRGRGNRRNW